MDLFCANCGEPWSLDYVVHEVPGEFTRKGSLIVHCPSCPKGKAKKSKRALAARTIAEVLGDDIDGAAAMSEDIEYPFD
jgi:hypothetical protein